MVISAVV